MTLAAPNPIENGFLDDVFEVIMIMCDSKTLEECYKVCSKYSNHPYFQTLWKRDFKIDAGGDLTALLPFMMESGVRKITLGCRYDKHPGESMKSKITPGRFREFMEKAADFIQHLTLDESLLLDAGQIQTGFVYYMPHLSKLCIHGSACNGQILGRLAKHCPQLSHFETGPDNDILPDEAMVAFCNAYPRMQTLKIGIAAQISDDTALAIENMIYLNQFSIKKCLITDEGVNHLAQLARLGSLQMEFADITPDTIGYLSSSPAGQYIKDLQLLLYENADLLCRKVGNSNLTKLRVLALGSKIAGMTDRGLEGLEKLNSELKKFRIVGTNETTEVGRQTLVARFLHLDTFFVNLVEVKLPSSYPKRKNEYKDGTTWEECCC